MMMTMYANMSGTRFNGLPIDSDRFTKFRNSLFELLLSKKDGITSTDNDLTISISYSAVVHIYKLKSDLVEVPLVRPLVLNVYSDGRLFRYDNVDLGIFCEGTDLSLLQEEISSEIASIYAYYTRFDDEHLTRDAIQLRDRLLQLVG